MKKEASITVFAGGRTRKRSVPFDRHGPDRILAKSFKTHMIDLTEEALPAGLDPADTIVFPAIHGTFGEDGALQSLLEKLVFLMRKRSRIEQALHGQAPVQEAVREAGVRVSPIFCFPTLERRRGAAVAELGLIWFLSRPIREAAWLFTS